MFFEKFDDSIHNEREQKERLVRAIDKKTKLLECDTETQQAVFQGSDGLHYTTINECSCTDFAFRNKPCKHMYRLAIECGIINPDEVPWSDFIEYVKERNKLLSKLKAEFSKRISKMDIEDLHKVTDFLEKL